MTARKRTGGKKRTIARTARKPAAPRTRPAKGGSDWVLGPYGDLMSRADYDAMMERQKNA